MSGHPDPADFTERAYARLLETARERFRFCRLADATGAAGECLWRHDVDVSPHRAVRLAEIEAERGLPAHYFVMLGSRFYNAHEPAVAARLRRLGGLGHEVGLHFDPMTDGRAASFEALAHRLGLEAAMLADIIGRPIASFSLHNPTAISGFSLDQARCAGLCNASSPALVGTFTYCSDSNGLWRHRPLGEVIADASVSRLYALTHPEWWTPEPLSPRARIQRAIDGRAANTGSDYDADLARFGRPNR
jgi:hypothetical protein